MAKFGKNISEVQRSSVICHLLSRRVDLQSWLTLQLPWIQISRPRPLPPRCPHNHTNPPSRLFAIPNMWHRLCTSTVKEKVYFHGTPPPDHGNPYPLVAIVVLIESAVAAALHPKHARPLDDLTGHQQAGSGGSGSPTSDAVVWLLWSHICDNTGMACQGSGGCC